MSQHIFNTNWNGKAISVLMGYDRPLDGYFMVIDRIQSDQVGDELEDEFENDDYIYSNLFESESHPKSLARYQHKLFELCIDVPVQMLEEIIEDRAQNIGNKRVLHSMVKGQYSRRVIE